METVITIDISGRIALPVRVTGEIIEYKGTPEIVVRYPSQIEVAVGG